MGSERKRKISLFGVVDDSSSVAAKALKAAANGGMANSTTTTSSMVNRWNGRPYSQRFYEILEVRKNLPVWHQKEEFLKVLKQNQTFILVGEIGSGKTTQVQLLLLLFLYFFYIYRKQKYFTYHR
ncbi:hypothetical protein LguiB_001444 [Lonicera macranthoides]